MTGRYRPTMTPITFGAARYFSSIAARAAARFSGVSNPRFSYAAGKLISEVMAINAGRQGFDRV